MHRRQKSPMALDDKSWMEARLSVAESDNHVEAQLQRKRNLRQTEIPNIFCRRIQ